MLMSPEKIRNIVNHRGSAAKWQMDIYEDLITATGKAIVAWLRMMANCQAGTDRGRLALRSAADTIEKEL